MFCLGSVGGGGTRLVKFGGFLLQGIECSKFILLVVYVCFDILEFNFQPLGLWLYICSLFFDCHTGELMALKIVG